MDLWQMTVLENCAYFDSAILKMLRLVCIYMEWECENYFGPIWENFNDLACPVQLLKESKNFATSGRRSIQNNDSQKNLSRQQRPADITDHRKEENKRRSGKFHSPPIYEVN